MQKYQVGIGDKPQNTASGGQVCAAALKAIKHSRKKRLRQALFLALFFPEFLIRHHCADQPRGKVFSDSGEGCIVYTSMGKMILAETLASSHQTDSVDFNTLVYAHARFLVNIAYAVLRNSEDAEDVAQEAFLKAFRAGGLEKVENMRAWLGRIAWRLALNRLRQRTGIEKKICPGDLLKTLPSREKGAEELLIRKEREMLLEKLLQALPHDLRDACVLLTVEGMTSGTVSKILGISESTVRDRHSRARKMMKEKLAVLMEGSYEP
jgi:RNA polymerase sigma-70 factor, ECF subfamily